MKNVVVISTGYYPDMFASSAVIDKYIQLLKGKYMFHVITATWKKEFPPLDDPFVKVYYVSSFWHRLRILIEERYRVNRSFLNRTLLLFFRIKSMFQWYFCYPFTTKWIINAYYKKLQELSEELNVDTVISVTGLISSQFAVKRFKKEHSSIKWITFFTDPFTTNVTYYPPYKWNLFRRRKNFKNEREIFNSADYNIIVENLYENVLHDFQQPRNKTFKLYYALEDIRSKYTSEILKSSSDDTIKLIFAGKLYRDIRNPEYMLSLVSQSDSLYLDLYLFGHECDHIVHRFESDKIVLKSAVDRMRYEQMICNEYDILVNIGNSVSNQLPSKMYELLSTGRPIVNFYQIKDIQYDLIERYPLGINIGKKDDNALSKLDSFCKEMKGKRLEFSEIEALYPENSLKEQVGVLEKLINC
jgi:hypothetical protein